MLPSPSRLHLSLAPKLFAAPLWPNQSDPWAAALQARAPSVPGQAAPVSDASKSLETRLQAQIKAQVDAATQAMAGRLEVGVQKLEVGVANVVTKVDMQEARLQTAQEKLFGQQTQRIEELLAPKRARTES